MTGDEYVALLVQRREEYYAKHGQPRPGFPALLEWFIRPGDEEIFTPPEPAPQPKRETTPRTYRSAAYWRQELARIEARMNALDPGPRHNTTDSAAYGGIGIRQTARQNRQWGQRIDKTAAEWVRLNTRRRQITAKLARAEAREATTP